MSEPERCHRCDRPRPTKRHSDCGCDGSGRGCRLKAPRCADVCWSLADCRSQGQPVDWRARALKAEAELADLRRSLADPVERVKAAVAWKPGT